MNKQELIGTVADQAGLTRGDAARAVEAVFATITEQLKRGHEVRLVGFGNFSTVETQGIDRPQPAHRRANGHRRVEPAQIPPRQEPERQLQLTLAVMGATLFVVGATGIEPVTPPV